MIGLRFRFCCRLFASVGNLEIGSRIISKTMIFIWKIEMKNQKKFLYQYSNLGSVGTTVASSAKEAEKNIRYKSMKLFGRFDIKDLRLIKELQPNENSKFN